MKRLSIVLVIAALLTNLGCSKSHFRDLNVNPDQPGTVPPYLLLTSVSVNSFTMVNPPDPGGASLRCHQTGNAQQPFVEQYWNWLQGNYSLYNTLLQVHQLKAEAAAFNEPQYDAIAKFFDAFNFYQLTMSFGDIPYTQAEQAASGSYNPVYDSQKSVFQGILKELDSANTELMPYSNGSGGNLLGDVIYGSSANDVMQWRKLINSFTLRVLLALSAQSADPDLQVIQHFQQIYNNPSTYPIFTGNADNGQLQYYNQNGDIYPLYKNTEVTRVFPDSVFCVFLTTNKDPRLFAFFTPTANSITAGKSSTDFTAYRGINASLPNTIAADTFTQSGNASGLNIRYTANPAPEPYVAVGYPELEFNLAEAAFRGWISADPAKFYQNGIQASMSFYEPYENLQAGTYQTATYFPVYYANPAITYNPAQGLQQIIYQKYIAFFYNSFEEPYYNLRRTGLPVLTLNGGGMQNNGVLPMRFMYPIAESQTNATNLSAAIQRQFPSTGDNINSVMWVLQ